MIPSEITNEDVKIRHRNTMTAKAILDDVEPVEGQQSSNQRDFAHSKKKLEAELIEDLCSSSEQCLVNSGERYMAHRNKRLLSCESSDDSLSNKSALISDCCEYEKETCIASKMRSNDLQRQGSQSQLLINNNASGSGIGCNSARILNTFLEIAIRVVLFCGIAKLERTTPFKRLIHPEEIWLYKNPMTKDYVPASTALIWITLAPTILIIVSFLVSRDRKDFSQAVHAFTLSLALNGFLTSLLKVSVGRPRPDFFYRCFPDGVMGESFDHCTGEVRVVNEGRKSFPSGHSSMSFAGFGFMSFYLASKLHIFNDRGRGQAWRLCISLVPLFVAMEVAVSRTCDYHHHWQDVLVGSVIGICVSYLCYRQYFPSIFARNCHRAFPRRGRLSAGHIEYEAVSTAAVDDTDENQPLVNSERENKWN